MKDYSINRESESLLSHTTLTNLLHYDEITGVFTWKVYMSSTAIEGQVAGSPHPKLGHISIQINGIRYLAHRLAWFYVHKEWPKGLVDHKNRNSQDNSIRNLRDTNQSVNMHNTGLKSDNTSGVKGVSYMSKKCCWRARINIRGKEIHLGTFLSREEALQARRKAEVELL